MPRGVVQIPVPVLSSVETLDELQDWLTAQNPQVMRELREARHEGLAGKFKPWQPRHTQWLRHRNRFQGGCVTGETGFCHRRPSRKQARLAGRERPRHDSSAPRRHA